MGHTAFIPKETQEWHMTKSQLKARMDTSMGGRAAEELIFGKEKITGGASSDLQSATGISVQMVTNLGMSEKFGNRILKPGLQQLAPVASLPGLSPPPIESLGSSRKNDGAITS